MKTVKLSIIIPVYNVETTLDKCIRSVIEQDFSDFEMLLIDDGSPDSSPEICDKWSKQDSRIKVFHKQNGGLSDARNYGMDRAQGDYVLFIDSDDELTPETISPLIQIIDQEQCDVLEYPAIVHAGHKSEYKFMPSHKKWASAREYWHTTLGWEHCYVCNKIFRKAFIKNIRFPKDRIFEDIWFMSDVLSHTPNIITCSKGLYLYIWNNSGITVNAGRKELWHLLCAQIRATYKLHTTPFSPNGYKLYRSMMCRLYDIIMGNTTRQD